MSYFERHVFFCCNQRKNGSACCEDHGASELRAYAKDRVKQLGLSGEGKTRINQAGCLDRCAEGPSVVIYPEGVWYTVKSETDVKEIMESHVMKGEVVSRLLMPDHPAPAKLPPLSK